MDRQDGKDRTGERLLYGTLTRSIIGCAFEVMNELGDGFLESVYENALIVALKERGIAVESQEAINVNFRGQVVGNFFADLIVESKVIVELKAVSALTRSHQAQVINYLNATGYQVGLLINFGNPKLEYKRFTRTNP